MRITDETREAFGTLLRDARNLRGWTQTEAARETGVAASTLSRLENAPYEGMRFEDVVLICRAYGIPVNNIAAMLGLGLGMGTGEEQAQDAELLGLGAAVRTLTPERRAFLLKVAHVMLKGLA